jgi:predicted component of type VI protein secretion system
LKFDKSIKQKQIKMQNLMFSKKSELADYTVEQIDLAIESLNDYQNHYVQTNQMEKLIKVVELQGMLIDVRCEKLGIVIF